MLAFVLRCDIDHAAAVFNCSELRRKIVGRDAIRVGMSLVIPKWALLPFSNDPRGALCHAAPAPHSPQRRRFT